MTILAHARLASLASPASFDPTPEDPKEWGDTLSGILVGLPLLLVGTVTAALAVARAVGLPQQRGWFSGQAGRPSSWLASRQPVLRVAAILAIFAVAGAVAEAQAVRQPR